MDEARASGGDAVGLSTEMEECVEACLDCHRICADTLRQCLDRGGELAAPDLVRALLDCIDICHTSADFMLRGSQLHPRTCGVCAEACRLCAEVCERYPDEPLLRACAEACRRCAELCTRMARMMTA